MERGQSIESPLLHQSDVIEKRMEMVAMLLNRINEEASLGQPMGQDDEDRRENNKQVPQMKEWLTRMFGSARSSSK